MTLVRFQGAIKQKKNSKTFDCANSTKKGQNHNKNDKNKKVKAVNDLELDDRGHLDHLLKQEPISA